MGMVDDLWARVVALTAEMNTTEWIIAAVVTGLLVLAIVKQMTKVALLAVLLVTVGALVLHGQDQHWSF